MNVQTIENLNDSSPSISEELDRLLKTVENVAYISAILSDKLEPILLPEESDKTLSSSSGTVLKTSPLAARLIQARDGIEYHIYKIEKIISRINV